MIRTHDVGVDGSFMNLIRQSAGHYKIVNTPACVLGAGVKHIAPPAVGTGHIGIQMPERIGKTVLQQSGECVSFFIRKAGIVSVGTGIF